MGPLVVAPKRRPDPERFWEKVEIRDPAECWEWGAHRNSKGYGHFTPYGKNPMPAHRFSYALVRGEIPVGMHLDHLCRNRGCVNPWHLEPVTPTEHAYRSHSVHVKVTHCPAGHEYTPENTYLRPGRRRYCRECHRIRERNRRATDVG